MKRDPEQCREFLREAQRLAGWHDPRFAEEAEHRLVKGAEEYGEDQFLEADCLREAWEEAVDGAGGWLTLQHQKAIIEGNMEGAYLLALAAAQFVQAGRIIDQYRQVSGY